MLLAKFKVVTQNIKYRGVPPSRAAKAVLLSGFIAGRVGASPLNIIIINIIRNVKENI